MLDVEMTDRGEQAIFACIARTQTYHVTDVRIARAMDGATIEDRQALYKIQGRKWRH